MYVEKLYQYIDDVEHGKIAACVWLKKAIKRFKSDLRRSNDADFLFTFMPRRVERVCSFAEMLKPGDMHGKTIHLLDWQIFVLSQLEGWVYKSDNKRRRFRMAYVELNRKQGKTTGILEPLVLFNFIMYRDSESYLLSSREDLAIKTFHEIRDIMQADKELADLVEFHQNVINMQDMDNKARLGFFTDGGKSADGFRPRFCVLDEYHEYNTDALLNSMVYGMRANPDAQCVMVTTADVDTGVPCYEQHLKSKRILNGLQVQDDFFCVIYALDEGDDIHDQSKWQKANPSLYQIIDPSIIQSDLDDAELTPHKLPELKAKTFGIWGGGSEKSWLPIETWQKNKDVDVEWDDFTGLDCFGGLDLSQTGDMTAFTLCFKKDGMLYFKHRFYVPESTVRTRYKKDNINFMDWVEKGLVKAIPGETINYDFVIADILQDAEQYHLLGLGYDTWQAKNVIQALEEERPDIALIAIEQSMKKLSPLTYAYEKQIKDGHVVDNNPVMLWMVNNVEAYYDPNNNIKLKKHDKSATQRIDGVVSSIMAYGVAENPAFRGEQITPMTFDELKALL